VRLNGSVVKARENANGDGFDYQIPITREYQIPVTHIDYQIPVTQNYQIPVTQSKEERYRTPVTQLKGQESSISTIRYCYSAKGTNNYPSISNKQVEYSAKGSARKMYLFRQQIGCFRN